MGEDLRRECRCPRQESSVPAGGDAVLGNLKTAIELMAQWRKAGDLPYQAVAGIGAMLAVVSIGTARRPSDIVVQSLDLISVGLFSRSFVLVAPPLVAGRSELVQEICLLIAATTYTAMVGMTFALRDRATDIETVADGMFNCRAASTFWLAVAVAAQQGPIVEQAKSAGRMIGYSVGMFLAVWVFIGLLYCAVRWLGRASATTFVVERIARPVVHFSLIVFMALVAIAVVPLKVPFAVAGWLCQFESETRREERERAARRCTSRLAGSGNVASRSRRGSAETRTHVGVRTVGLRVRG